MPEPSTPACPSPGTLPNVTYPTEFVRGIADHLMRRDWNLPDRQALEEAREIVVAVTNAVDKLRASEVPEIERLREQARLVVHELEGDSDWTAERWCTAAENALAHMRAEAPHA